MIKNIGSSLTMGGEPMRVAPRVDLSSEDPAAREQQARGRSLPRLVERSRIVLRAADGLQYREIAAELGITPEKVARWRKRFLDRSMLLKRAGRRCASG
jgi:DNA-directed RNA polymerase specialized sigma24 family protein